MIKLIATDMDGTLLDQAGNIPIDFFKTLIQLKKKDIHLVIASGRSYSDLKPFFEPFSNQIDFICDNGAYVISQHLEPQFSLIPPNQIQYILTLCKEIPNVKVILSGPNGMYATPCTPKFESILARYFLNIKVVDDLGNVTDPIHRICICDLNNPKINSFPILSKTLSNLFRVTVSGEIWLDVTNLNVNKGAALARLQKRLHIKKEQTMAFGDYYNDIEMLKQAEYSFVMANANPDMFTYGNYKAKSHEENGVLQAIDEYVFSSKKVQ